MSWFGWRRPDRPKKFLKRYRGQSVDELLALTATHRIDSIVLAFEEALERKLDTRGGAALSEPEWVVLAVEALEREVNNGGYSQFFYNSSHAYARRIEAALVAIGCPENAAVARAAVAAMDIEGDFNEDAVNAAFDAGGETLEHALDALDDRFYAASEPIAEHLFAYIQSHRAAIELA